MSWSAIWGNLKDFGLYLPVSLWFNFRHLPFKQACRLPILIGASRISTCRGRVRIESDRIRPGMIRLGRKCTGIFPRQRFLWENRGSVVFKGNPDSGRELCCVGFPQTDMLSSCLFRNEYADRMGLHILRYGLPSYQIRGGRGRAGSHGACELRQPATAGQADMPCGRGKRAWKRKRNMGQYAHYQLIISRL